MLLQSLARTPQPPTRRLKLALFHPSRAADRPPSSESIAEHLIWRPSPLHRACLLACLFVARLDGPHRRQHRLHARIERAHGACFLATMATMRPNEVSLSTTPTLSATPLPVADTAKKPTAPRTPRVDVEPLYAAVKAAIADADWTAYKKSLSDFLLGELNQEELSWRLGRILTTPALERAHNALVAAMYANCWRDAPEAGIAGWVSSSDKPSSGTAKGAGDESEKRLKYEVMQLSRRERKRLKTIPAGDSVSAGPETVGVGTVQEYIDARRVKQPEVGPTNIQGGSYSKTSTRSPISPLSPSTNSNPSRLGPRNPQTLHLVPLLRNPRIPHRIHNLPPPPPHLLRIRAPPRPHARLPRLPQSRDRNVHQRSARLIPLKSQLQRPRLHPHRRVQKARRARRAPCRTRRADARGARGTASGSRGEAEEKSTLHGGSETGVGAGGFLSGTHAAGCRSDHQLAVPRHRGRRGHVCLAVRITTTTPAAATTATTAAAKGLSQWRHWCRNQRHINPTRRRRLHRPNATRRRAHLGLARRKRPPSCPPRRCPRRGPQLGRFVTKHVTPLFFSLFLFLCLPLYWNRCLHFWRAETWVFFLCSPGR